MMNSTNLVLRIVIIAIFANFSIDFGIFAKNVDFSKIEGVWILKDVKVLDKRDGSVTEAEVIPEDMYYACPRKIIFDEEDQQSTFVYDNGEEKKAFYYVFPDNLRILFSIESNSSVPEKQFTLERDEEEIERETDVQTTMQLRYSTPEDDDLQEIRYIYIYELQK
jgi:hypothetical protein